MNGSLVLDVSVALGWCFEDEITSASMDLLTDLWTHDIVVPALWHTELANALVMGERRHRIDAVAIASFLGLMRDLRIETDVGANVDSVIETARRFGLTAYDAAYLALARHRSIPLATHDAALRRAAGEAGITLLPGPTPPPPQPSRPGA